MKPTRFNFLLISILVLSVSAMAVAGKDEILLKNGNIITISGADIKGGDILIKGSKIEKIGNNIKAGPDTLVIDLNGRWVMPGIIDSHSHIAIEGGVNETGGLMTAEVDVKDVLDPEDYNIFLALTGGVTAVHTMHGSANPIGGRGIVLKLRWGGAAPEMIFKGAPETVKWALGENPKQSGFSMGRGRYPKTRMGVEASIRAIFEEARDYMKAWDDYNKKKDNKSKLLPPKKDLRLEVIADVLRGKYLIRCHAYEAEEMLSIMKLCKEYGVNLAVFEHGLEGYRITNELIKYGVGVSTFADFWAYKWEAFKTMPHSAALMAKRGVLVALNSDDAERMRRLFLDAAKTMRFGGLSENEALRLITINPAKMLGIDKWVGTLEPGKDADIAVFSRHPLDPYTFCEMTIVDGKVLFDRAKYFEDRKKAAEIKKQKEEQKKAEEMKKKESEKKPDENLKKPDSKSVETQAPKGGN
jgi:imidazolonepropionase-like amidohydrolase